MPMRVGGGGGGGSGDATVANILARGETRRGIQIALTNAEASADWGLLVGEREAGNVRAEVNSVSKTVTIFYAVQDTVSDIVRGLESDGNVEASLIHGTFPTLQVEPHFQTARPFVSGEPYGQYAEVYTPAEALFEHPVPATALFEDADASTDGLTVMLGEPLEYGLDVNRWGITGHQRYQGTPDTPAQNPTLVEMDMPADTPGAAHYVGAHSTDAEAEADTDYNGTNVNVYYDTDDNQLRTKNPDPATDWFLSSNQANERARVGYYPLAFPYNGSAAVASYEFADADAAVQYILNTNFQAGRMGDDSRFSFDRQYFYYNVAEDELKVITGLTPAQAATTATFDLPTRADGGIRVTAMNAGAAGNGFQLTILTRTQTGIGSQLAGNRHVRLLIGPGETAGLLFAQFAGVAALNAELTAAYYGNEDGSGVIQQGGVLVTGLGGTHTTAGGANAVYQVAAIPGEPEEPIHIILDENARDTTQLDEEAFPTNAPRAPQYVTFIGVFDTDAAATAALGGRTAAVYYNPGHALNNFNPFLETTDGGASWGALFGQAFLRDLLGIRWLELPYLVGQRISDQGRFANAAAALAYIQANLADFDSNFAWGYFDTTLNQVRLINVGTYLPAPAMEIYYNIAAGGRLTGPDTLGDIHDYINTHLAGLTSDYAGGADMDTPVTRPFANRSAFSGGALSGLRILLEPPLARGADGNNWIFNARARFPGGPEVSERQAHILLYTNTGRTGGVRIDLEADIQGLNEHGVPVDISSGALGNAWTFTAVDATPTLQNIVTIDTANRRLTYYAGFGYVDVAAGVIHDACNVAGTGCSARYFGSSSQGAHPFDGALGRINTLPQHFHNGRDFHPATSTADPIAVAIGPENATVRIFTGVTQGIELEVVDPEGDGGNGWRIEETQGTVTEVTVVENSRVAQLSIPNNGSQASAILAAFAASPHFTGRYFGAETGTTVVMRNAVGQLEFLGGLDDEEIEVTYAPVAAGAITRPDRMGEVKAVVDAIRGLSSYYYGGADANTTANRLTPWEHLFQNGGSDDIDLVSFGLGPEQNVFTGTDRAAAEAARDTYAAANPAWVIAYRGRPEIWISLRWGDQGDQIGQVLRATAQNPPVAGDWIDQALALKGEKGDKGDVGTAYADGTTILGTGNLNDAFRVAQSILDRITTLEGYHRAPTRTYYFGWSDDRMIDASDFANFNSSMTFEGTLPARTTNGYIVIAVPDAEGVPNELFVAGGGDSIDAYERQTGTVNDPDGVPHIVLVSRQQQSFLLAGESVVLGY